ncbi:unnamed protein product [Protopolystoma xenopodis]|uniref:Uncharacterized protein n=1 Tax=Protopolystoma xenopodis TaxID=117903 RepID=A0A448X959_9PLAT|nr:unnamed protein product [Protopolystoma xenopodis]
MRTSWKWLQTGSWQPIGAHDSSSSPARRNEARHWTLGQQFDGKAVWQCGAKLCDCSKRASYNRQLKSGGPD